MTTDIEEQLAASMREYADRLRLGDGVLASATRRHRRHRIVWRCTVASAMVALVAIAVAVAVPPRLRPAPLARPPQPSPTASVARTVGYVMDQVLTAIDAPDDRIEYTHWSEPETGVVRGDDWFDPVTRTIRASVYHRAGPTERDILTVTANGQTDTTVVFYDTHTYSTSHEPAKAGDGAGFQPFTPDQLRAWLRGDTGDVTILGPEMVNGVMSLHLHFSGPGRAVIPDLWVDDTTYKLMRVIRVLGGVTFRADLQWLPRTPENLAVLTLVPPPGFTRQNP